MVIPLMRAAAAWRKLTSSQAKMKLRLRRRQKMDQSRLVSIQAALAAEDSSDVSENESPPAPTMVPPQVRAAVPSKADFEALAGTYVRQRLSITLQKAVAAQFQRDHLNRLNSTPRDEDLGASLAP